MFELIDNVPDNAVIKVIGVGGGGGNAVRHMIENHVEGVDFICANTDAQALAGIESRTSLQLGGEITKGLGAGANPDIGRATSVVTRCPGPCPAPVCLRALTHIPLARGRLQGTAQHFYCDDNVVMRQLARLYREPPTMSDRDGSIGPL